ncbi:MAG: hypothetical protein QOJ56_4621 [Mycobacterium sp.]|jgi:hypothetical protein|nr:hypothetical protein [Mycobacterium sp.]MDT5318980.1 hypothetical protein [Mycobacterium sp.]MDT5356089.1 hypothetical protein [Mycobacterium sp.]MDT7763527.1 hypothetical protein [Mycobacterium sp.]
MIMPSYPDDSVFDTPEAMRNRSYAARNDGDYTKTKRRADNSSGIIRLTMMA